MLWPGSQGTEFAGDQGQGDPKKTTSVPGPWSLHLYNRSSDTHLLHLSQVPSGNCVSLPEMEKEGGVEREVKTGRLERAWNP
jgi:hypothetical protein